MDGTDSGVTVAAPQARHDGPPNDQVHNLSRLAKKEGRRTLFRGNEGGSIGCYGTRIHQKKNVGEIEVEVARR